MPITAGSGTFSELVANVAHGEIDADATTELRKLVTEMILVEQTIGGKPKGKLVLTLDMALERGVFDTRASIKVTNPPKAKPRAFLFAGKDGGLSESDTRQGMLDLKTEPKDPVTHGVKVHDIADRRMLAANDNRE